MEKKNIPGFTPCLEWIDRQYEMMYHSLVLLSATNSGSFNLKGLDRMCGHLTDMTAPLNGQLEFISLEPVCRINHKGETEHLPVGKALHMHKRLDAPLKVLLSCHMDTVFPENSDFQQSVLLDKNILKGPGVADAKGGIVVMLTALAALENSPWANNIGWEILITPDEEIGSPGSATLLDRLAGNSDLGLVFEPSFPDGGLALARSGSGNFTAVARGRSAHAGRDFHEGRNAICALSDFVRAIDDLNGQKGGVTVNPGFIRGGGPENIVPDLAVLRFNIRIPTPEDQAWVLTQLDRIKDTLNRKEGVHIELHGRFNRRPKVLNRANHRLIELIDTCGNELGIKLGWQDTGGCCDGNNLAAAGLPNVDNLGVRGGNIHSTDEYVHLESLTERTKLSALFLMRLASGEMKWK